MTHFHTYGNIEMKLADPLNKQAAVRIRKLNTPTYIAKDKKRKTPDEKNPSTCFS